MTESNHKSKAGKSGQGKGKGKTMEEIKESLYREPDSENSKYPGAIKKNKHVMAIMRDNKSWKLAKILEIRYL